MYVRTGTDFMNAMDDVMICYVLQRTRRPLFNNISVYISGTYNLFFSVLYSGVQCCTERTVVKIWNFTNGSEVRRKSGKHREIGREEDKQR